MMCPWLVRSPQNMYMHAYETFFKVILRNKRCHTITVIVVDYPI